MLTIYHLGVSQSDRVVWMAEELGIPYELEWFDRGPDGLMPPEYRALHPAATAPVIRDGDTVIAESAAILEHLSHRYGKGRLSVPPGAPSYTDYIYWMHFNNNVQGLFFSRLALGDREDERIEGFIRRREDGYYGYLDQRLAQVPYLAGDAFTCADIMVTFNLTALAAFGGPKLDDLPNVAPYLARIGARPAYQKAMAIAGPAASRPH